MSQYLAFARAWLAAIDPAAPAATLILLVFVAIYSLRRWFPRVWAQVEKLVPAVDFFDPSPALKAVGKVVQAIPGMLLGAVVAALTAGLSVKSAALGVLSGAIAAVAHEVMVAYQGKVGGPTKPPSSSSGSGNAPVAASPGAPESSFFNPKPAPPNDAAMRSTETLVHYTLSLAAFALLIGSALVSCTPAEVTVEKKTLANAETAIDKYCDARDKYIVIEEPDAGVPVSADAGAKP